MRNSQDTHKVATHVKTNDAVGEITNVLWNGYFICISSFWNKMYDFVGYKFYEGCYVVVELNVM